VRPGLTGQVLAIPSGMAGISFDSCTGRAISVRDDRPAAGRAKILIAAPHCWPSPERAIAAVTGRRATVVISAGLDEIIYFSLIKAGIISVRLTPESVAALQNAVESDPGILLTVDIGRSEVRARAGVMARFDTGGAAEMARRLLMAQRLLGSCGLEGDALMRLQRRLVAIGDALKVPAADVERCAWRLDRLMSDIAQAAMQGPAGSDREPGEAPNSLFP
jgi:energy-converting hydrogenase Eha subunit C